MPAFPDVFQRTRTAACLVALLLISTALPAVAQDQPRVKVGETAPDFKLQDQNGKQVQLKELLKKKPVALVFYRSASW